MSRKIKVIDVVLSAPYQIGEYSYTNICKTVQLAIPDDGHDWHVYGESNNEVVERRMRDDLISRKALREEVKKYRDSNFSNTDRTSYALSYVIGIINNQPTDFETIGRGNENGQKEINSWQEVPAEAQSRYIRDSTGSGAMAEMRADNGYRCDIQQRF